MLVPQLMHTMSYFVTSVHREDSRFGGSKCANSIRHAIISIYKIKCFNFFVNSIF